MRSYDNTILFCVFWTVVAPSFASAGIFGIASTRAVSGSIPKSCDGSIGDTLEKKLIDLLEEASSLPVKLSRDGGNIEIRTTFDGPHMISIADAKVDQPPSAFKGFLENFIETFKEHPMVTSIESLGEDQNESHEEREGLKVHLRFPFPLSPRVMIHWKYSKLNRNMDQDEHLMIFSEENNESLMDKHFTKEEEKRYVCARTFLSAYWIKPVRDSNDNIIGSTIKYVYSGDVGGMVPKKIQNWAASQTTLDSVNTLIAYGKKDLKK